MSEYAQRTVDWLKNNSRCMEQSMERLDYMCCAEYMPGYLTDSEIWVRYYCDETIGLTKAYFKRRKK